MSSEDAAPTTTVPDLEEPPSQEVPAADDRSYELPEEAEKDLPPLRLHATRVPARLHSPAPPVPATSHVRRRSLDRLNSNPRTRSRSPSLASFDSQSSLEDFVDSDILTDKMGLEELDCKEQQHIGHVLHQSSGSLPCVHERMSEATLDDVYAFSDITPSLPSRGNSTVGTAGDVGSSLLETLDEGDSESEEDVEANAGVILTNMENIAIQEQAELEEEEEEELPPLRLHATRVTARLHSPAPTPVTAASPRVRRKSLDRKNSNPRSRSRSPSLSKKDTSTTADAGSSLSSLEELVDSDILTDKMGLEELDRKEQQNVVGHVLHQSSGSLPPVHERMSEATLDDVYAFSDVKTPSLPSRGNSTVGTGGDVGSYLLETLDECDSESEEEAEANPGVILTNMENLTIQEHGEDGDGDDVTSLDPVCGGMESL